MAKTERMYASAELDGASSASASSSVVEAIANLVVEGEKHKRDLLWDTLEVSIETDQIDMRTFASLSTPTQTYRYIQVSALGVLK